MNVDLQEFRSAFVAEAEEHLASIQSLLLEVEPSSRQGRTSPREVRTLLRLLHTMKGLSAMVGIEPVVSLSHKMETVLRTAERAGVPLDDRAIEVLLSGARAIASRVRAVADDRPVPPPPADLLRALEAFDPAPSKEAPRAPLPLPPELLTKLSSSEQEQLREGALAGRRAVRVDFAPSSERAARGFSITSVRERLGRIAEVVKVLPLTTPASAAVPGGLLFALLLLTDAADDELAATVELDASAVVPLLAHQEAPPAAEVADPLPFLRDEEDDRLIDEGRGMLRVEVRRVDDAIEMLGSLVVTRSRLAHAVDALEQRGVDARDLRAIMADNARQLRDLRSAILRIRMVPMTTVLERLPLVVRGLGRSTSKRVRLVLDTGNGELDKSVAERLFPALVHLLRNAVDHGVESPAERASSGKPEVATITIDSVAGDRFVELRISDDGKGVDREAVAARAARPVPRTDRELLDMLCTPGLSTRREVDTTSGRGLGMDIVRQTVARLGGELSLETVPRHGTTFVVRVPLTVAIVDAFIVRCGADHGRYAVPVPIVDEIVELGPARIVAGPQSIGRLLARRGEAIPLFDLAEVLRIPTSAAASHGLVVRRGPGELFAFGVDRVLGQQEIVVRPIVDPLVSAPSLSGSTDLGDGRATLVLDLASIQVEKTTDTPGPSARGRAA